MDAIQTAYIVTKVVSSSFAHHEEVFSIGECDCLFSWLIIYIVVRKFALLDFSIFHLQILTDAYTIFNDFSHYNNTNLLLSIY
jgi:hypothetical protein